MPFGGSWQLLSAGARSLPCRRSRVRVPSSASRDPLETAGFFLPKVRESTKLARFAVISQLLVSLQGAIAASLITTDQLITRPPTGAGSGPSEPQAAYVSAFIPRSLRERLEESARANDRSISGEVRMALRQYFADSSGVPPTPSELRLPRGRRTSRERRRLSDRSRRAPVRADLEPAHRQRSRRRSRTQGARSRRALEGGKLMRRTRFAVGGVLFVVALAVVLPAAVLAGPDGSASVSFGIRKLVAQAQLGHRRS